MILAASASSSVFTVGIAERLTVGCSNASGFTISCIIDHGQNSLRACAERNKGKNGQEAEELDGESVFVPQYPAAHNSGLDFKKNDPIDGKWISAIAVSPNGHLIAVADNFKFLCVYQINFDANQTFKDSTVVASWFLAKRTMAMKFSSDASVLVVADKIGDAYIYEVKRAPAVEPNVPVLGHVSVLTDVALTDDMQLVLTSDRDEKIRVSHLPNADDIQTFCLGHTQFVSKILIPVADANLVLAGAGDGSIKAFDYLNGRQVGLLPCDKPDTGSESASLPTILGLSYHAKSRLLFFSRSGEDSVHGYEMDVNWSDKSCVKGLSFHEKVSIKVPYGCNGIRALNLVGDCLLVLINSVQTPLMYFNLAGINIPHAEGVEKVNLSDDAAMNAYLREVIQSVVTKESDSEVLVRDPFYEFLPSARVKLDFVATNKRRRESDSSLPLLIST